MRRHNKSRVKAKADPEYICPDGELSEGESIPSPRNRSTRQTRGRNKSARRFLEKTFVPHQLSPILENEDFQEEDEIEAAFATSKKRSAPGPARSPSKRVRAEEPRRSAQSNPISGADGLNLDDAEILFRSLKERPRVLNLGEMGALFLCLQMMSFHFAQKHFGFDLSRQQQQAWPLHQLAVEYLPLMVMAQFIADGSQNSWRSFFTKPEHRIPLVHGMLGEWFKQRIFNHTAFSIAGGDLIELEKVDKKWLKYDAFVRTKMKAIHLENMDTEGFFTGSQHHHNLDTASYELAQMFLTGMQPLLPPVVFDPLRGNRELSPMEKEARDLCQHDIFMDLVSLVKYVAVLHLSIRLTGVNGTVVRIAPHIPKGSVYHPSAPTICVNSKFCNATKPKHKDEADELRVRMTCWGRVEAFVPHGPTCFEMEEVQADYQAKAPDKEFRWEDVEDQVFPLFPYDLQETEEGRAIVEVQNPIPGTELHFHLAKAVAAEQRKQQNNDHFDEEYSGPAQRIRGSFVTYYSNLCPSNVYCTWDSSRRGSMSSPELEEQKVPAQTLWEAVQQARREKGLYYQAQSLGVNIFQSMIKYNVEEWVAFIGGFAGAMFVCNTVNANKGWCKFCETSGLALGLSRIGEWSAKVAQQFRDKILSGPQFWPGDAVTETLSRSNSIASRYVSAVPRLSSAITNTVTLTTTTPIFEGITTTMTASQHTVLVERLSEINEAAVSEPPSPLAPPLNPRLASE